MFAHIAIFSFCVVVLLLEILFIVQASSRLGIWKWQRELPGILLFSVPWVGYYLDKKLRLRIALATRKVRTGKRRVKLIRSLSWLRRRGYAVILTLLLILAVVAGIWACARLYQHRRFISLLCDAGSGPTGFMYNKAMNLSIPTGPAGTAWTIADVVLGSGLSQVGEAGFADCNEPQLACFWFDLPGAVRVFISEPHRICPTRDIMWDPAPGYVPRPGPASACIEDLTRDARTHVASPAKVIMMDSDEYKAYCRTLECKLLEFGRGDLIWECTGENLRSLMVETVPPSLSNRIAAQAYAWFGDMGWYEYVIDGYVFPEGSCYAYRVAIIFYRNVDKRNTYLPIQTEAARSRVAEILGNLRFNSGPIDRSQWVAKAKADINLLRPAKQ
jgi:hypothetical protein